MAALIHKITQEYLRYLVQCLVSVRFRSFGIIKIRLRFYWKEIEKSKISNGSIFALIADDVNLALCYQFIATLSLVLLNLWWPLVLLSDWLNSFCIYNLPDCLEYNLELICQIGWNATLPESLLTGDNLGVKFWSKGQSGHEVFSLETIWGWGFGPKVRPLRQSGGEVFSLEAIWGWGFGPKVRPLTHSGDEVFSLEAIWGVRVWSKGSSLEAIRGWSFLTGGNLGVRVWSKGSSLEAIWVWSYHWSEAGGLLNLWVWSIWVAFF